MDVEDLRFSFNKTEYTLEECMEWRKIGTLIAIILDHVRDEEHFQVTDIKEKQVDGFYKIVGFRIEFIGDARNKTVQERSLLRLINWVRGGARHYKVGDARYVCLNDVKFYHYQATCVHSYSPGLPQLDEAHLKDVIEDCDFRRCLYMQSVLQNANYGVFVRDILE